MLEASRACLFTAAPNGVVVANFQLERVRVRVRVRRVGALVRFVSCGPRRAHTDCATRAALETPRSWPFSSPDRAEARDKIN